MDVHAYITSGILEEYCLGLLTAAEMREVEQYAAAWPEVKAEIHAFCKALEQCAMATAAQVPEPVRNKVLGLVDNLAKEKGAGTELPIINKYSSHEYWLRTAKQLLPETLQHGFFVKVLRSDEAAFQSIIWTGNDIPDEMHDDMRESFIILEGECECRLGDDIIKLGPGGFLDIPLHTRHSVKVLGGPVLAVLQRLKIA